MQRLGGKVRGARGAHDGLECRAELLPSPVVIGDDMGVAMPQRP